MSPLSTVVLYQSSCPYFLGENKLQFILRFVRSTGYTCTDR